MGKILGDAWREVTIRVGADFVKLVTVLSLPGAGYPRPDSSL